MEETNDPTHASRYAVNALMVLVAGLIAVAVANEMVIAHPQGHDGHASAALSLLLFGGPVLFLAAWAMPPYVALILVGASLTTLAILDLRSTPATMETA